MKGCALTTERGSAGERKQLENVGPDGRLPLKHPTLKIFQACGRNVEEQRVPSEALKVLMVLFDA